MDSIPYVASLRCLKTKIILFESFYFFYPIYLIVSVMVKTNVLL